MQDPSPQTNRPPTLFLLLCQAIACGVVVAWCLPRVKPPMVFGVGFGALMGVCSILLTRRLSGQRVHPRYQDAVVFAVIGTAMTLGLAALRQIPALPPSATDAAASVLIETLQNAPVDSSENSVMPSNPGYFRDPEPLRPMERVSEYLWLRYGSLVGLPAHTGFWLEIALAGLSAALVVENFACRQPSVEEVEPPL